MHSPAWRERRKEKLAEVGYRCQGCDEDERLEVHHLTYERLGREPMRDLMVLCRLCHAREHNRTPNVGPIAGPSLAEIQHKAREDDKLRRRQELIANRMAWIKGLENVEVAALEYLEWAESIGASNRRLRKRFGSIQYAIQSGINEAIETIQRA